MDLNVLTNELQAACVDVAQDVPPAIAEGRENYIGASEVGMCSRIVVWRKLNPEVRISLDTAGLFLRGRALEGVGVKIMRKAAKRMGMDVAFTGWNQQAYKSDEAPIVAHPDGVITYSEGMIPFDVKTTFNLNSEPPQYQKDQSVVQAGLMGAEFGLLLRVQAGCPSKFTVKRVDFDRETFSEMYARAERMMDHVLNRLLPEGEPTRGFCSSCPIKNDCGARKLAVAERKEGSELPFDVALEVETIIEELAKLAPDEVADASKKIEELKKQLKALIAPTGVREIDLPAADIKLTTQTRSSFDHKALEKEDPATFAKYNRVNQIATLSISFRSDL